MTALLELSKKALPLLARGICLTARTMWWVTKRVLLVCILTTIMITSFKMTKAQLAKQKYLHTMVIYQGLIDEVKNPSELAAIIGHEFAHLELGHTTAQSHTFYNEYHADMLGIYYMRMAGYNPCAASGIWERLGKNEIALMPVTHPTMLSRAQYLTFPNCADYKGEAVEFDAREVYYKVRAVIESRIKYRTIMYINELPVVNAYVYSEPQTH